MTTLSLSPSDFRDDEIQAAEALLVLFFPQTKSTTSSSFLRWGATRRRSVLKTEQENKPGVQRLSPSTPLSFSPSGGEETPPSPAAAKIFKNKEQAAAKIFRNKEQHKEWVKEQSKRIATLSATKSTLQQIMSYSSVFFFSVMFFAYLFKFYLLLFFQCVSEAKSRYQTLRETNSWLKEMQLKLRETMVQQRRQLMYEIQSSSKSELDLFPVGPACLVGHHHPPRWRQLDLNRRTAAEWRRQQQRASAYAQARKRRIELQRVKSSLKIQRLR